MDTEVFDHHYGQLRATYREQRRLQDMLGIIDPVLPLTSVSTGLAGTDLLHHDRFTIAAEHHRRLMVRRVNDYLAETAVADNRVEENVRQARFVAPVGFFKTIPAFSYRPPTFTEVIAEYKWNLLILGVWLSAAIWLAVYSVRRMEPGTR